MDLRFVTPDLRRLDLLVSELVVSPIYLGERPPRGCSGLLDYRLGGRISEVLRSGAIRGEVGEKVLLSGGRRLPYDKILLYGCGEPTGFNPQIYAGLIDLLLESLSKWGIRRAVVELPGRSKDLIDPEKAAEILLSRAGSNPIYDTWTLVDTPEAQRLISKRLSGDRRNQWRMESQRGS